MNRPPFEGFSPLRVLPQERVSVETTVTVYGRMHTPRRR